jgi:hypothetical protein
MLVVTVSAKATVIWQDFNIAGGVVPSPSQTGDNVAVQILYFPCPIMSVISRLD